MWLNYIPLLSEKSRNCLDSSFRLYDTFAKRRGGGGGREGLENKLPVILTGNDGSWWQTTDFHWIQSNIKNVTFNISENITIYL